MSRIACILVGGLALLAIQAKGLADDDSLAQSHVWRGDCSKGAVEVRLDCLNWQVEQLKRRLDGRDGRVLPLGQ
jgi:hypothetical protein